MLRVHHSDRASRWCWNGLFFCSSVRLWTSVRNRR